ncbi:cation/H(+) antiporter 15-like [Vicia villosa]|uniref:cation/H(+) antiporter 15-like n=1 Tax=Vicia villosa TaxID=3911 RepID=UPI00273B2C56|nr:cation/H(+) antiporter 15-like [Vicia villosa]
MSMADSTVNATVNAITTNGTVWICEQVSKNPRSRGIFFSDNPFSYTLPVLFVQISLVSSLTAVLQFLLQPIGETRFFPQMLAGMMLGPSVIGQSAFLQKWLFPPKTFYISKTIAFFGGMMFMFLIGVKIDLSIVAKSGKKAWAIGILSFFVPLLFSSVVFFVAREAIPPDHPLYNSLISITFIFSCGSFHVTTIHLADLKLLNSEMGRLAISSSMVSGTISLMVVSAVITHENIFSIEDKTANLMGLSLLVMITFIVCVLRPIMCWMIRQTPEGRQMKESYILSVFLMLIGCAFFSEVIGQHVLILPIILGIAVPEGPPLGSALTDRLDTLVSHIFLPLYFLYGGSRFNIFLIDGQTFVIVQVIAIVASFGKIVGTILPSIYWKMPMTDVLALGLLMSAQGITQLIYLQNGLNITIDEQSYGNALIALTWLTGVTTPFVKFLYDPSKRYLSLNRRRTIEQSTQDIELRLMACIHSQETTPSIINLLEISNPSLENPICFYVLHLLQLRGRSTPVFVDHQSTSKKNHSQKNYSEHIINAFRSYEQQKSNNVVVKLYTSISPYETMHDEICMQVAEKRVCLLIVPFHRQWKSNGITESTHPIRALNLQLLRTAPCSVGILIERGTLNISHPIANAAFYSVGIVFIEGNDDREALAYAMRMANNPIVRVTLVRIMEPRKKNKNLINKDPDGDLIHRFKVDCIQIKRHDYKEEVVRDSVEMINVLRSFEGCFDLVLVGRRHASESCLFSGLNYWNEYPELGPIGDMLVASDSTFDGSVMVIQQQKRSGIGYHDLNLDSGVLSRQENLTIMEVPRDK